MTSEHRQPATTRQTAPSVPASPAGTPSGQAGLPPADLEEELELERDQEYAELGGEG